MKFKKFTDSPNLDDVIQFELTTYDDNGILANPVILDKVIIYFVERGFDNSKHHEEVYYDPILLGEYNDLQGKVENGIRLKELKKRLELTSLKSGFYYKNMEPVMITKSPLWSEEKKIIENSSPGKFQFYWKPKGMRDGDYIIKWIWKNTVTKSSRYSFFLKPQTKIKTYLTLKNVPTDKYEYLLYLYTPSVYKNKLTEDDVTPIVINNLNQSIAAGFSLVEGYANQLIHLLDADEAPAGILNLLGNFLGLRLKSDDEFLWRRQIKQAVPLYKKKGTYDGLRIALGQAGVKLLKLSRLWQVVSPYYWTDYFKVSNPDYEEVAGKFGMIIGRLTKVPISELKIYLKSSEDYTLLPNKFVLVKDGILIWNGENLDEEVKLFNGDSIKVFYQYKEVPIGKENINDYINSLSLADQREEAGYPLKNWNIRLIEEDDPLFALIVSERHSFVDPVIYGRVRTTFLFSEKVYNMDTFNGSLRESNLPCDIDKDFVDSCNNCLSSKFTIYVEMDNPTEDKVMEIRDIVKEYSPFHAILHELHIRTRNMEFMPAPDEHINYFIKKRPVEKVKQAEKIICQIRRGDTVERFDL